MPPLAEEVGQGPVRVRRPAAASLYASRRGMGGSPRPLRRHGVYGRGGREPHGRTSHVAKKSEKVLKIP